MVGAIDCHCLFCWIKHVSVAPLSTDSKGPGDIVSEFSPCFQWAFNVKDCLLLSRTWFMCCCFDEQVCFEHLIFAKFLAACNGWEKQIEIERVLNCFRLVFCLNCLWKKLVAKQFTWDACWLAKTLHRPHQILVDHHGQRAQSFGAKGFVVSAWLQMYGICGMALVFLSTLLRNLVLSSIKRQVFTKGAYHRLMEVRFIANYVGWFSRSAKFNYLEYFLYEIQWQK